MRGSGEIFGVLDFVSVDGEEEVVTWGTTLLAKTMTHNESHPILLQILKDKELGQK